MFDFMTGLKLGSELYYFIPPIVLLFVDILLCVVIYKVVFGSILPTKTFNFFLKPVALLGFFIWVFPMKLGFIEFFRAMF